MKEIIQNEKFVELKYQIIDEKTGDVLTGVDFPVGYVHGVNKILSPQVTEELEGKSVGQIIDIPIDGNLIYGPRDESLVITDFLENVPEEYHEVGTTIIMEKENGDTKNFIVTRVDEKSITIDGNNPLCGRNVIFKLEVLSVREATEAEIAAGGKIEKGPDFDGGIAVPL
ncbi:MAG: peptidylprolyl isomerase [Gammaproteobacteria bacterium]|nr:peptidylprolyl isomerase [Gammaproteobacteria bacterium]